jgi:hypothetical protein
MSNWFYGPAMHDHVMRSAEVGDRAAEAEDIEAGSPVLAEVHVWPEPEAKA